MNFRICLRLYSKVIEQRIIRLGLEKKSQKQNTFIRERKKNGRKNTCGFDHGFRFDEQPSSHRNTAH